MTRKQLEDAVVEAAQTKAEAEDVVTLAVWRHSDGSVDCVRPGSEWEQHYGDIRGWLREGATQITIMREDGQ